jgi:hypothetical protein
MTSQSTQQLIEERDATYGVAWKASGYALQPLAKQVIGLLLKAPEAFFPWLMIHNKLIRILANPHHIDSWRDIAGYAELMVQDIERESAKKGTEYHGKV